MPEYQVPALNTRSPLLWLLLSLVLSACGSNPYSLPKIESGEPTVAEPAPTTEAPPASQPEPAPRQHETSAHSSLLAKADAARDSGDFDQSLAYLERAQRIDPDNAQIYLGLAQTHAAAGNMTQAKATAERGLLYCSGSSQCSALRAYTR
jgi:tetratricopeptide (TPR) repeat protein